MIEDKTPTGSARRKKANSRSHLRLENARKSKLSALKTKLRKEQFRRQRQGVQNNARLRIPDIPKNVLQSPPTPKAKFRKRQKYKAWLPTHLFHAKRAHLTPPKEPLWRMTIPLSPTQKCYRPTHRAAHARGAIAWDMSYMSTIGLLGAESSIMKLFRSLGIGATSDSWWTSTASKWVSGKRSWEGWSFTQDPRQPSPIAPVQILWRSMAEDGQAGPESTLSCRATLKRQVFIRVHPSAFMQLWDELLRASKTQKPAISVEDLRFEIGSIEISGPSATEALVGTLWPVRAHGDGNEREGYESPQNIWRNLCVLSNPAQLPAGASLGFDIVDPRLHHPPRTVDTKLNHQSQELLFQWLSFWPIDKTQQPQRLFERDSRVRASRQLPSQKAINRRKGLVRNGAYPDPLPSDPSIPLIILAHRNEARNNGSWTVLLPWKCVLPIWYSLMFYPLSTGGTIRFGGLEQKRQVAFEAGTPWFPGDYPGTDAGRAWESREQRNRKSAWESRPKGRRIEWEKANLGKQRKGEIGMGWACDWEYLSDGDQEHAKPTPGPLRQYTMVEAQKLLQRKSIDTSNKAYGLASIKITLLNRGVAHACARIYRLPTIDMELRQQWVDLAPPSAKSSHHRHSGKPKAAMDVPAHERRQYLAAMLLGESSMTNTTQSESVVVPDERDLVGFVTTGNFNLSEGKGTSIGSVVLAKVINNPSDSSVSNDDFASSRHLCIIRESGQGQGRLARWELA